MSNGSRELGSFFNLTTDAAGAVENREIDLAFFLLHHDEPMPAPLSECEDLVPSSFVECGTWYLNKGDRTITLWYKGYDSISKAKPIVRCSTEECVTVQNIFITRTAGDIEPGSSGAPVFCEQTGRLCGVTFAVDKNNSYAVSFPVFFAMYKRFEIVAPALRKLLSIMVDKSFPDNGLDFIRNILRTLYDKKELGDIGFLVELVNTATSGLDNDQRTLLIEAVNVVTSVSMRQFIRYGARIALPRLTSNDADDY